MKFRQRQVPDERASVNEERGGAGDPELGAGRHIGGHGGAMTPALQALGEGAGFDPDLGRVPLERVGCQIGLGEEQIMVRPELALVSRAARGFVGERGLGVEVLERKVPKHPADTVGIAERTGL